MEVGVPGGAEFMCLGGGRYAVWPDGSVFSMGAPGAIVVMVVIFDVVATLGCLLHVAIVAFTTSSSSFLL